MRKKKREIRFENPQYVDKMRRQRTRIVMILCALGFMLVTVRAVHLHTSTDPRLKWIADKQYRAVIPQAPLRGKVLDANGKELAGSMPVQSAYTDPSTVTDPEEFVRLLSTVVSIDKERILKALKSKKKFAWIKRKVSTKEETALRDLKSPSIFFVEERTRFYPNGRLASNILGAVGMDSEALSGVELAYDEHLRSKAPDIQMTRDARGRTYSTITDGSNEPSISSIKLTIDSNVQFIAEQALQRVVEDSKARAGIIIAMDTQTGAVRAMANYPSFDPNEYSKYPPEMWRNRAVTDQFEPGSTFKTLIVASALEAGTVTPEKKFDCEMGSIKVANAVLHDHNPYGSLSVEDIIKVSSNIGALKVSRTMEKERLYNSLKAFGIGKKTGIDLPGEENGNLRAVENWHPVEYATISFGQGLSVTPLQMTAALGAIANGGHLMRPYLVDKIENNLGNVFYEAKPTEIGRPISDKTAAQVRKMLARVVGPGGTGTRAASSEYLFGGKTGTAQKVSPGQKSYTGGKYFASFVGIAPIDDPKLAIFVGIDEPQGQYYGGTVAAPAFKELAEGALHYMGVPSAASPVVYTASMPPVEESVGVVIDEGVGVPKFVASGSGAMTVPDVTGLNMRQVLDALSDVQVKAEFKGTGVAIGQNPAPGSEIKSGTLFSVRFKQPE